MRIGAQAPCILRGVWQVRPPLEPHFWLWRTRRYVPNMSNVPYMPHVYTMCHKKSTSPRGSHWDRIFGCRGGGGYTLSEKYSLQWFLYSKCPRTLTFSERGSKAIQCRRIVKKCPIHIYYTVPSYSKYPRTYIYLLYSAFVY